MAQPKLIQIQSEWVFHFTTELVGSGVIHYIFDIKAIPKADIKAVITRIMFLWVR